VGHDIWSSKIVNALEEDEPIRVERLRCVGDAIGLFGRPSAFEFLQRSRLFPV
jgi:hypothetical protein